MTWEILQALLWILIVGTLGFVVGDLLHRSFGKEGVPRRDAEAGRVRQSAAPTVAPPDVVPATAPRPLDQPRPADSTPPVSARSVAPDAGMVSEDEGRKPPSLDTAPADPDDLKLIRGIGRQNEQKLNQIGIYKHGQIAAWTSEEERWVSVHLAFPGRVEREEWVAQARELSDAKG